MTITLVVMIVGLIVHFINARMASPDGTIEMASRAAYWLGLAFTLAGVIGKTAL